jgi:AraC-like DNA-binding protein
LIFNHFVSLQIAPRDSTDFTGRIETSRVGHLAASSVTSTPQTFTRTPKLLSKDGRDLLQVGLITHGQGVLTQDGRTATVSAGDFALYETARPFTWDMTGDWRLLVFTWPRDSVVLSESDAQRITAIAVCSQDGVGRYLSPALSELANPSGALSDATAARVADQFAELSVVAALEATHFDDVIPATDDFRKIQIFIEDTLDDPSLTPQLIAQHFYLSTRTLHRLFARRGLTVAGWIRTRRLDACRRTLLADPGLSVTEIGSRYGFSNPEVFSRTFAAAFGSSPSSFRKSHLR